MQINGKCYESVTLNLKEFLVENKINEQMVVVEINGVIIEQSTYDDRVLQADDKVEIVSFVGGG